MKDKNETIQEWLDAFPGSWIDEEVIFMAGVTSDAQRTFFDKLLDERDFGDQDTDKLRTQFSKLNQKSGSAWIEAAMKLSKRDDSKDPVVAAPFGN